MFIIYIYIYIFPYGHRLSTWFRPFSTKAVRFEICPRGLSLYLGFLLVWSPNKLVFACSAKTCVCRNCISTSPQQIARCTFIAVASTTFCHVKVTNTHEGGGETTAKTGGWDGFRIKMAVEKTGWWSDVFDFRSEMFVIFNNISRPSFFELEMVPRRY